MAGRNIEAFRPIGKRLAGLRAEHRLTQRQLAERLGQPHSYVGKLELAERRLDIVDLEAIARALQMSPDVLLARLLGSDDTTSIISR